MEDTFSDPATSDPPATEAHAYTVLARKYRPQDFSTLVGQDSLVRVLTAAFQKDRIPHAVMLTGLRGVGKTTTARIIAKGLNCLEADGPTITPCGRCENCLAIADSRHVDVLEMDAASRTGIDDIREIIESVRYRAAQARYKVYIIDEVHMLSKNAFNGLLKTLEEPPPHVKFILATTDIHKVPVTVLSRCMRFDLPRVAPETMTAHLQSICDAEGVEIAADALALLARASEGSVRDALSLLDQAISHGAGSVTEPALRDMMGLAEAGRAYDLFEKIMGGDAVGALEDLRALYADGADPKSVMVELSVACHLVTMARIAPGSETHPILTPLERDRSRALSERLTVRALSRAWQMILKAIEEVDRAPSAMPAAEMAVIRMTHVAELPPPGDLVRAISEGRLPPAAPAGGDGEAQAGPSARAASLDGGTTRTTGRAPDSPSGAETAAARVELQPPETPPDGPRRLAVASSNAAATADPAYASPPGASPQITPEDPVEHPSDADAGPRTFEELVALIRARRDAKLLVDVERFVRPGPISPGRFEFTPAAGAPSALAGELADRLKRWTGARWVVSVADGHAGETLAERRAARQEDLRGQALAHPLVQATLAAFPGAELRQVRDLAQTPLTPTAAAEGDPIEVDEIDDDGLFDDGFDE